MITPDRLQEVIQRMFDAQLDRLKFMMVWEFQVQNVDNGPPVMCQLVSVDPRMPNCDVMLRPGADGAYCTPAEGSTVLVGFAGGDPSKPYIFATDYNSPTTTSSNATTESDVFAPVVKIGDILARPVAHSLEVSTDMTAISTIITAIGVYAAAILAGGGGTGPLVDPGGGATSTLATAVSTAVSAIAGQAATLPTTKGEMT